jgi:hypothetical protein
LMQTCFGGSSQFYWEILGVPSMLPTQIKAFALVTIIIVLLRLWKLL